LWPSGGLGGVWNGGGRSWSGSSRVASSRPVSGFWGGGVALSQPVDYYVHSRRGCDGNAGTSPATPFQTLTRALDAVYSVGCPNPNTQFVIHVAGATAPCTVSLPPPYAPYTLDEPVYYDDVPNFPISDPLPGPPPCVGLTCTANPSCTSLPFCSTSPGGGSCWPAASPCPPPGGCAWDFGQEVFPLFVKRPWVSFVWDSANSDPLSWSNPTGPRAVPAIRRTNPPAPPSRTALRIEGYSPAQPTRTVVVSGVGFLESGIALAAGPGETSRPELSGFSITNALPSITMDTQGALDEPGVLDPLLTGLTVVGKGIPYTDLSTARRWSVIYGSAQVGGTISGSISGCLIGDFKTNPPYQRPYAAIWLTMTGTPPTDPPVYVAPTGIFTDISSNTISGVYSSPPIPQFGFKWGIVLQLNGGGDGFQSPRITGNQIGATEEEAIRVYSANAASVYSEPRVEGNTITNCAFNGGFAAITVTNAQAAVGSTHPGLRMRARITQNTIADTGKGPGAPSITDPCSPPPCGNSRDAIRVRDAGNPPASANVSGLLQLTVANNEITGGTGNGIVLDLQNIRITGGSTLDGNEILSNCGTGIYNYVHPPVGFVAQSDIPIVNNMIGFNVGDGIRNNVVNPSMSVTAKPPVVWDTIAFNGGISVVNVNSSEIFPVWNSILVGSVCGGSATEFTGLPATSFHFSRVYPLLPYMDNCFATPASSIQLQYNATGGMDLHLVSNCGTPGMPSCPASCTSLASPSFWHDRVTPSPAAPIPALDIDGDPRVRDTVGVGNDGDPMCMDRNFAEAGADEKFP